MIVMLQGSICGFRAARTFSFFMTSATGLAAPWKDTTSTPSFNLANVIPMAAGNEGVRVLRERWSVCFRVSKVDRNAAPLRTRREAIPSLPHWQGQSPAVKTLSRPRSAS